MHKDMRNDPLFKQAEDLTRAWLRPGSGEAALLGQLAVSPDGRRVVGAASICDALEGLSSRDGGSATRLALVDLSSGDMQILTHGPRSDNAPVWSPDGSAIAFLSDREQAHIYRLRILDPDSGEDRATAAVDGFVEAAAWSADGRTILLSVAGFGSDLAGAQGAIAVDLESDADLPDWSPVIEGGPEAAAWRSAWLYDVASDTARPITPPGANVWQAAWCGPDHIAAICSDQPEETWWYNADVRMIAIDGSSTRTLFTPEDQLGRLTVSPSGQTVAVIEAVCSDRNIVAGDLRLIDVASGAVTRPATLDADAVQLHWRGDDQLLFVAAQGPGTVVGLLDRQTQQSREIWRDGERTPSGTMFPEVAPLGAAPADMVFLAESFFEPQRLIAFEAGTEREVRRFGSPDTDAFVRPLGTARDFAWTAPDGLTIHGWLITPPGPDPFPVIMQVHGGPVWYTRPLYVGRSAFAQMALSAGYALFQPNPRGSSGRGQPFARHVFGDMGGADTYDYLSGLDALEAAGLIDPKRIGVTGGSYGGYISNWIITQDQRFAASVPIAPIGNWVSQHYTCNVPTFCAMFLADDPGNPNGKYFHHSPVHHAHKVKTPTLSIAGALDHITPPTQALEFHRAIQGTGVESMLVTYPFEGHGVRSMPAQFDFTARVVGWFLRHMPPDRD